MALTKIGKEGITGIDNSSNATAITIDSSGNVGIGTSSPSPASGSDTTLEIAGSAGPSLTINDTGQAEKYSLLANADDLKIYYGSTPMVSFQNNGNVGIGTASPSEKFEINTGTGNIGAKIVSTDSLAVIAFKDNSTTDVQYLGANGDSLVFHAGASSSERMRINASGNVGIGTTTPAGVFHVHNGSGDANAFITSANTNSTTLFFGDTDSNTIGRIQYDHSSNYMRFSTNGSEAMRITSGGDLSLTGDSGAGETNLVFTANSNTTKARIQGSKVGSFEGKLIFSVASSGGSLTERMRITDDTVGVFTTDQVARLCVESNFTAFTGVNVKNNNSGHGGVFVNFQNYQGTQAGSISHSGSTSVSYNTSSDHRLKENVTADWDATTRLKQLNPVRFNFISDADTTVDGFLAHEVQSVVPEAITGTHNEVDDDGNPVYQGIDQSKLVPLLVKTIQELEARITVLENA